VSTMSFAIRRPAPRAAAAALWAFATVAVALGAARAVTTTYVPVLLERIADRPGLIGAVMLVNAAAGFVVPIAAGLWSDRRGSRGPFIIGGSIVAAGGLVAVALGNASSYAVLALAAATVYIGLNAASTAHRALVAERFAADRRAAATGAQEGAMLAGALAGTLAGGALIDGSPIALFTLWAILLPLLALPTLAWQRASAPVESAPAPAKEHEGSTLRLLLEVLRRDGARHVLISQVLWVASYAALAPFMVLYAEDVLGLTAAAAGAVLAGFGVLTGLGMLAGARMPADRLHTTLVAGVTLLGGGLLAGTAASNLVQGAVPFAAAALGAGLVSAVGFPYFTRFVPTGQEGRYAGAFFSARAIATTAALPTAGLLIAATGSYRALMGMGVLGLAALIPLARAERRAEVAVTSDAAVTEAAANAAAVETAAVETAAVETAAGTAAAGEAATGVIAVAKNHSGEVIADARLGDFIPGPREGEFIAGARAGEYVDEGHDRPAADEDGQRPPIRRLAAVVPVFRSQRAGAVAAATLAHVDHLVLVDDGAPAEIAAQLEEAARDPRIRVVTLGGNHGKGAAVAAGIDAALEHAPDAVVVLDSDGQHPPELIPAFARAAATADVVIGDRARAGAMPRIRRVSNALSSWALSLVVRRRLRDTQNGMRLFRAEALRDVSLPAGRYEAETRHLKALIRSGRDVAWVPMPAIYGGEPSSFRSVADTLLVTRAIFTRPRPEAAPVAAPAPKPAEVVREWAPRIFAGMLLAWAVAAAFPLLAPLDEQLFLAINGLGDGPEWLYQALDPHSRNYLLMAGATTLAVLIATRRLRYAGGALLAMAFAGVFADLVLELIQLGVNRPRPEEALGAEVQRSHGRHWSHIPSFPSGHLIVTTAMVVTAMSIARVLRAPLMVYLAAIAVTRMTFGAHFPLDVLLGTIVGVQVGLATAALLRASRLLPPAPARERQTAAGALAPDPATA
jgi:predicted MFS family arabinose efflux permease/membrane-associated phospholipid phosphatase